VHDDQVLGGAVGEVRRAVALVELLDRRGCHPADRVRGVAAEEGEERTGALARGNSGGAGGAGSGPTRTLFGMGPPVPPGGGA
jgi:hypothetical protein